MGRSLNMSKTPGKKPLFLAAILILAILLSGCTDYVKQIQDSFTQSNDPVLRKSEPYIKPIDTENATLRAMAVSIVNGGPYGDKEYQVNKAYRYVVEQYAYYSDPRTRDYIQPPYDTIAIRGGDCEDLSILLCSLLENLGIRTYLVLTENHAYCLASGMDIDKLKGYAQQSLLEQLADDYNTKNGGKSMIAEGGKLYRLTEEHESTTVRGGYVMYFGGNGSQLEDPIRSVDWEYEVDSSAPITVYLVPSRSDYEAICQNRPFNACPGTEARNIVHISDSYEGMDTNGGLALKNDGRSDAAVTINIKKYTNYETDDILMGMRFTTYVLNNQTCVVLDPTAGKYGYPGFSAKNETGERLAIDPVTKQYYYLG
jgi:hypothetical protein